MSNTSITFDGLQIDLHNGLSSEQVQQSTEKYGTNTLTRPQRDPWWVQLLEKFEDPTIRILLAAAVISILMTVLEKFVLKNPEASFIDSIGIVLAVALATLAGFFSELKSAREFELLNKVKDDILIKVFRDGQITEVSINAIVVGDLVHLDLGDKVPADGVVLDAMGLLIDQSVMTGESVPVEKHANRIDHLISTNIQNLDDTLQVYRGTMVSDGHGMFLVTEVGDKTKLGQIAANLGQEGESENETPLTQKLSVLARQISVVGVCSAMLIFMVMGIATIWNSQLFANLLNNQNPLIGLSVISLIVGFLVMWFVLRPFFANMDMEMNDIRLQFLSSIPMVVAMFGLCLGIWGVFDEHGSASMAMEMFRSLLTCFVIAVTIIVVAVPEGLPMMVTVSLAMNMMKMARENCLIRKLVASETIGSATIVCTDKTGTLTQNRMTSTWIFVGLKEVDENEFETIKNLPEWKTLIDLISANSEASLNIKLDESKSGGKVIIEGIGNPTECALLRLLYDVGIDYREHRDKYLRIWELSHNSARKISLVAVEKNNARILYAKGAPERLIGCCSHVMVNGCREPIEKHQTVIDAALLNAQGQALRVIAFTIKQSELPINEESFKEENAEQFLEYRDNTLYALIGITDPIRSEAAHAIEICHTAGVNVKMITGDAKPTAVAIAKKAGILSPDFQSSDFETEIKRGQVVLTSNELAELSESKLVEAIPHLRVLARSTPMDKLRLVKAMHRQGEVVAMTGDGTNDAPALKFADVGISMGITGTEVAKEASDIVLIDDNFKSIVTGIWWGRTLYQNIQRFLQFQLSVNVTALSCALIGPLVGVPLPLTVPQLLWINIIMDTFAAIALSTEPPRKKTMERKPVLREASIITPSMGVSILLNSFYQVVILFMALSFGWFLESRDSFTFYIEPRAAENLQALTVFFTIFVMFQFWHKFNCRSLHYDESPFELLSKNRLFLLIVGMITTVQVVMVQASDYFGIGQIFRTEALSLVQWLEISLLTATILPFAWLVRLLVHQLGLEGTQNVNPRDIDPRW